MPDVLVADDDPGARAVLTAAFEAAGYTVRQAGDGTAALRAIDEATPDCLVVDLGLPRLSESAIATRKGHARGGIDQRVIDCDTGTRAQATLEVDLPLVTLVGAVNERFLGIDIIGINLQSEDEGAFLPIIAGLSTAGEIRIF